MVCCFGRYNENAPAALQELQRICGRPLEAKAGVEPTNLFSRNADVNTVNEDRLQALPGDLVRALAIRPCPCDGAYSQRNCAM